MVLSKIFNRNKKKVTKAKDYIYTDGTIYDYILKNNQLEILFESYQDYLSRIVFRDVSFFKEDSDVKGLCVVDEKFKNLKNGRKKALFYVCNDNDEEPAMEIEYQDGYVDSNPNLDEWPEYLKLQKEREFNIANKQNN
jgi:hypothetical protein